MAGELAAAGGVWLLACTPAHRDACAEEARALAADLELGDAITLRRATLGGAPCLQLALQAQARERWMPGHDTLGLRSRLDGVAALSDAAVLQREAFVAMLGGPVPFGFPNVGELASALRMRQYTAQAAARTALRFHTTGLERPADCWAYHESSGFVLRPNRSLIDALRRATQPGQSEPLYSFSCYRATEYVLLLALAQELLEVNPRLLESLQGQWRRRAVASGRFHDVFLREFGSTHEPLPARYYVAGDRVWFRNPDEASSDAAGYEGSWTFYLGGGEFANLWKRGQPFTLEAKCLELYHWRHATFVDDEGELRIDEALVERRVRQSLLDRAECESILERMMRMRDLRGVYAEGGCLDRTRECLRWVHPATTDLVLPSAAAP